MLRESKGNMYNFVSHTWNPIKGECLHNCKYCYMKKWGPQKPVRFDESELKTHLGHGNNIFVGSSTDLFAQNVKDEWLNEILNHCRKFTNGYLFQSKDVQNLRRFIPKMPYKTLIVTTIESNRFYEGIYNQAPPTHQRAMHMALIKNKIKAITVEPILDFDLNEFVEMLEYTGATQINIGADSCGHKMPEPSKQKLIQLIEKLETFTKVVQKKNLSRLLK